MKMLRSLWLAAWVALLAGAPLLVTAQVETAPSQVRYIDELKQRNSDYGPGCNGIGISVPATVDMPAEISSRWAGGHSACIPGLRLIVTCIGDVAGADRVVGCLLEVADGEAEGTITCERFTLIAPDARFTPDPDLSGALSRGSGGAAKPCSDAQDFAPGVIVAAAFLGPAEDSAGDLALLVDVDGSEVPAFLIPAGQLGVAAAGVSP